MIGLLLSVIVPLTLKDSQLPDGIKGFVTGIGIGILLLAVFFKNRQANRGKGYID